MYSGLPFLIDSIFGKQDLEAVSLDEIREVIAEFPSFNAAHYFLSRKLKALNDDAYEIESKRTALYFNNALWLQSILEEDYPIMPAVQPLVDREDTFQAPPVVKQEDVFEVFQETNDSSANVSPEDPVEMKRQSFEISLEPIPESREEFNRASFETTQENLGEYGIFEDTEPNSDNDSFDRPIDHSHSGEFHEAATPVEDPPPPVDENILENEIKVTETVERADYDSEAFDRPLDVDFGTREADDTEKSDNPVADHNTAIDAPIQELVSRFIEQRAIVSSFDTKKAEEIVFAPYHVIDYFASQGIKLILEDQPADSFGKQLKSFTDWLKVMKKLPVLPTAEKPDEKEADRVRNFAAHSIEERDIMTETMAEVLAKQGMYENAISLYQKLSLIYPPKSAYFASRIEQLKSSLP